MEKRKPEFHLWLVRPIHGDGYFLKTVLEIEAAIKLKKDIDTYLVCMISTDLFNKGYRIFVHDDVHDKFEITLGSCDRTDRELRMGHNLEKMLLSGAFYLKCGLEPVLDPPDKLQEYIPEDRIEDLLARACNIITSDNHIDMTNLNHTPILLGDTEHIDCPQHKPIWTDEGLHEGGDQNGLSETVETTEEVSKGDG